MKKLILEGRFHVQHIRDKKIIADFEFKNGICDAGVNSMWDTFFGVTSPVSQVATWYIGLVDGATTPTFLAADTLASHTGWTENTNYSGNRKAWNNLTAASARAKNSVLVCGCYWNICCPLVYGCFPEWSGCVCQC